jgi:hypothetical protein
MSSSNVWGGADAGRECILATGRRVKILPFTVEVYRLIERARKKKDNNAIRKLPTTIAQKVVRIKDESGNWIPVHNFARELLGVEEAEILYLAKIVTIGSMLPVNFTCRVCGHIEEHLPIPMTQFPRQLIECGDPACPCHEINEEASQFIHDHEDEFGGVWDHMKYMDMAWGEVPANHLELAPPDLIFRPEWPDVPGAAIHLQFPRVSQKLILASADAEKRLDTYLLQMIVDLEAEGSPLASGQDKPKRVIRKAIEAIGGRSVSRLVEIRTWLEARLGGIEPETYVTCPDCSSSTMFAVVPDADFFLREGLPSQT